MADPSHPEVAPEKGYADAVPEKSSPEVLHEHNEKVPGRHDPELTTRPGKAVALNIVENPLKVSIKTVSVPLYRP